VLKPPWFLGSAEPYDQSAPQKNVADTWTTEDAYTAVPQLAARRVPAERHGLTLPLSVMYTVTLSRHAT
jgi:hypothetical protein